MIVVNSGKTTVVVDTEAVEREESNNQRPLEKVDLDARLAQQFSLDPMLTAYKIGLDSNISSHRSISVNSELSVVVKTSLSLIKRIITT